MKYSEYNKSGRLQSGDIFLFANQQLTDNFGIYAKDMMSGLLESNPNSYSVNFNDFDNITFVGHQMGAKGEMSHVNNLLLNKARAKLATGQSFTVMRAGDGLVGLSAGVDNQGLFAVPLTNLIKRYGSQGYGYKFPQVSSSGGGLYLDGNAGPQSENIWLDNFWGITGSPDYVFLGPYYTHNFTNVLSDTIDLYYIEGQNLGSFNVYTGGHRSVDGNFALYTGVNASAGVSGAKLIRINYSSPGYRQLKIESSGQTTGRILFPMVAYYNTQDQINKIRWYGYTNEGGIQYRHMSGRLDSTRNRVRDVIFSGISPDLILTSCIMTGNTWPTEISGYFSYLNEIKTKWPEATVVVCADYPGLASRAGAVDILRSGAIKYQYPFFDGHTPFVDYLTWSGRGYASSTLDGVHPSNSGVNAYGQILWDWLNF